MTTRPKIKSQFGPVPLYFQIQQQLQRLIEEGSLKPGDALPTGAQICREYGVSRITVGRAFDTLAAKGLITRRQGVGTFVSEGPSKSVMLTGSLEEVLAPAPEHHQRLLSRMNVIPPADVSSALRLPPESRVAVFETLHSGKDGPFSFSRMFVSRRTAAFVDEAVLQASKPIIHIADAAFGKALTRAEQTIDAESPKKVVTDLLGLKARTPLLRVRRTYFVSDDMPIATVIAWYHSERFRYMIRLLPDSQREQ